MAFVKSIPEPEESVAAVMGRYPAMATCEAAGGGAPEGAAERVGRCVAALK